MTAGLDGMHGYGKGWVPSNKEWDRWHVKPFHDVEVSRNAYLEIDEAKRLVNACEPDFRLLVQAALLTGARYSSLCNLRVEDFNSDLRTLHIRKSKSGKPYYVVLSPEGVPFFRGITAGRPKKEIMLRNDGRIQRALEKERERLKALGKDPSKASVKDEGEWRTAEQTRLMREACERATIGHWESIKKGKETVKRFLPKISFHGLRHSWASLALMNGTPMMVVAQNLGHKDTTMLQHHYGHIDKIKQQAINEGAPRFGFEPDHKIAVLN
jgi:integrase